MPVIEGILPALVTPFRGEELDTEALRSLVEHLIGRGVSGVVVAGTTGEFPYLSMEERKAALEAVVDQVNGRVPVVAGAGASSTSEAVEHARVAEDIGADALLVVSPYYFKPSEKGIYQHYLELMSRVELPVLAYNIPQCTGYYIPRSVLEDLAAEGLSGVKDSSGNLPYLAEVASYLKGKATVLCGHDEVVLSALVLGASGAILASANVIPEVWLRVYKAFKEGRLEEARTMQARAQKLARLIARHGPLAVKAALRDLGLPAGRCRSPLEPGGSLPREVREEIRLELAKLGAVPMELPAEAEVYIEVEAGPKDSEVGYRWARELARPKAFREALLAVAEPNLAARPPTLIVPEVDVRSLRQASMVYGPVQAAVARAVIDSIGSVIPPEACETHVIIARVKLSPSLVDRGAVYWSAYRGMLKALKEVKWG